MILREGDKCDSALRYQSRPYSSNDIASYDCKRAGEAEIQLYRSSESQESKSKHLSEALTWFRKGCDLKDKESCEKVSELEPK